MRDLLDNFSDLESFMYYIEEHYSSYSKKELASVLITIIQSLNYSLQSGEDAEALFDIIKDNYEED